MIPLSLYVHLPWCVRKCPYCDFNSHALAQGAQLPEDEYLDALRADLESTLPSVWGRSVGSVFLGGGTPSLFSPRGIDRLLGDIRSLLPLQAGAEITMEANPGTFERERFRGFRDAGVNRLSLGVQSFDDASLRALGRIHDGGQARLAAAHMRETFPTGNLDLMYGLPGQDVQGALADLRCALDLDPPHLSLYSLTLEPGTPFHQRPPVLPDEDQHADIEAALHAALRAAGYEQYEVSAWARPGAQCRHNRNYWSFGDYLGVGAGAHAKITHPDGTIVREERRRVPAAYLEDARAGRFVAARREVGEADRVFEFALCALRLHEGFTPQGFEERTGLPFARIEPAVARARLRGLLEPGEPVRATPLGWRFLSDLQESFLQAT